MFDRQNQPAWLKLVNLVAVLCIILIVFIPLREQPVWLTTLLLISFVLIAGVNFAIQFRDVLFRQGADAGDIQEEQGKEEEEHEATIDKKMAP